MGMFTRIIHPTDGRELQIKAGWDDMEEYKVGDEVNWKIFPEYPGEGKLLDGVYESFSNRGDCYVVIEDHQVSSIIERNSDSAQLEYIKNLNEEVLVPFKREWWTESAWVEKEIKELKRELKHKKEQLDFLKTLVGKSDEEILKARQEHFASVMAESVSKMVGYSSLVRKIFK